MRESASIFGQTAANWKRFGRQLLVVGENRFALLTVEIQEERVRIVQALLMTLGVASFALLAGITLSAAIVVGLWEWSPVAVLAILTALYGAVAGFLYARLAADLRGWRMLSATRDQFQKDRTLLEETFS